jgi:elongator complex protein 3
MLKPLKNEVRKPTRSISGVTPVAVMLPPRACNHGDCLYCPSLDVPQSYTPKSPVVIRAAEVGYDSYKQVQARLKAFQAMHHPTDKVEIIIMGGTFLQYEKDFQYKFVKGCYDALNGKVSKNLAEAKKINETAKHRCTALCIETRPDVCIEFIPRLLEFGCTRVELGVQIIDDKIYEKIKRGHKVKDVVASTKKLKDAGFKVGYHIMPGLPFSNMKNDMKLFRKLFSDERFKPDQLKIYPCQVIKGSKLEKLYFDGKYKPYGKEETEKILIEMLKIVPRYCRVMRVMREIPPDYMVAGTTRIDLRKDVEAELRKKNSKIVEIRYREVGFNPSELDLKLKLKITKYKASGGQEYFLEIVNKDDILFGLLRLRIVKGKTIIRELHVYGKEVKLGEKGIVSQFAIPLGMDYTASREIVQHRGLGKWLMTEAEKIIKKNKIKELKVISGVGVREYYKKLGYELEKEYMVKEI